MLYILLIIIAIGILLAGEAGQKLLTVFIMLAILASGFFLILLLVAGGIVLIQDKTAVSYIGIIILSCGVGYGLYEIYKKYQRRELKKSITGIINRAFPQKNEFKKYKKTVIFIILAYTYLATMIIYSLASWIIRNIAN